MPRRTNVNRSPRRAPAAPERSREPKGRRAAGPSVDAQALTLREGGSSYSEIARRLELARAVDAHKSFVRALQTYEGEDRRRLVANEQARLDQLERRIRERDAADQEKIDRRVLAVAKLREAIA
jgi:hypothetical protein